MNHSFFIGATAAYQQDKRMGIHGNNIANVNTYGFKAERSRFTQLMYADLPVASGGNDETGAGTALLTSATNHAAGNAAHTERDLDFMIQGDGYFGVADLATGEVTYTRCGAFSKSRLVQPTGEIDEYGRPVLEERWYLSDGKERFVMGESGGMIEIVNNEPSEKIGVFDFLNYDGMRHVEDTRFVPADKNGGLRRGTGEVVSGYLEISNVDLAEELTKVIESQRAYGMALKLVQASDEIETTINGLRG